MQLPPNPKLRNVIKICKSSKDVDFVSAFFDASITALYPSVRHRYNELVDIVANGVSHLKLFTKFLKQIIDAQQLSSNSCIRILEQYKDEEPTLTTASFVKLADETSVTSPHFSEEKTSSSDVSELHKKTDLDAFSDVFSFERNMGKLLVMYWNRLNSEIYEPLYEYRKTCISKLEAIQEYVSDKYDKLIKHATKLRETKVATISYWNDLCDLKHTLRKQRSNAPDSSKTKKLANKVKSIQSKVRKQFESVVEQVDRFNNVSDEFWNEIICKACLQLEAMEYSRIAFYTEYFDKYHELLKWRKCELENGSNTLQRARNMLMSPFEIAEYGIHPIRVDSGNYNAIQPQQYELPCMPDDIQNLTGKITEQRIDPSILIPVYNPFTEGLKPSTSRHIKSNYSRADSISSLAHDRNFSQSVSVSQSMTSIIGPHDAPFGMQMHAQNAKLFSSANTNTASKLFSRTHRAQTHNGGVGLPRLNTYESDSHSHEHSQNSVEYTASTPSLGSVAAPPGKPPPKPYGKPPAKPPRKGPSQIKPPLPVRARPLPSPSPSGSPVGSPRPNLPPRPMGMRVKTPTSPYKGQKFVKPPELPPRRRTMPMGDFKRKPPKKNPVKVAEAVRKTSSIYTSDNHNAFHHEVGGDRKNS